jgi:hypothetical protein
MHVFVQKAVQRMQAYLCSTRTRVALDCCCITIVLHQWFFFDGPCLIGRGRSLDDLVQPPLHLRLWERWADHGVLPQGLGSTGPPSDCWVPMLDGVSARFVCLFALVMALCMVRFLGNLCTSVYFAECSLMVCYANRILATWSGPVIT